jgi:hypothetical protein
MSQQYYSNTQQYISNKSNKSINTNELLNKYKKFNLKI